MKFLILLGLIGLVAAKPAIKVDTARLDQLPGKVRKKSCTKSSKALAVSGVDAEQSTARRAANCFISETHQMAKHTMHTIL